MSKQDGVNLNAADVDREELEVDVLVVGAGAAGLACAIQLKRELSERGKPDASLLVLEKAEDVGYHVLSGAVMDPRGMAELFPDWKEKGCPVESEVTFDCVDYLKSGGGKQRLSGVLVPPALRNHGNYIVSMYRVTGWLREQAEALEIEVYPGFAGAGVLYDGDRVVGVQTRDAGIAKDGTRKGHFEPGMDVKARVTVFAEGTRGSLAKGLIARNGLDQGKNHQIYETGIKEIWKPAGGARPRAPRQRDPHDGGAARLRRLRRRLPLRADGQPARHRVRRRPRPPRRAPRPARVLRAVEAAPGDRAPPRGRRGAALRRQDDSGRRLLRHAAAARRRLLPRRRLGRLREHVAPEGGPPGDQVGDDGGRGHRRRAREGRHVGSGPRWIHAPLRGLLGEGRAVERAQLPPGVPGGVLHGHPRRRRPARQRRARPGRPAPVAARPRHGPRDPVRAWRSRPSTRG